MLKDCLNQRLSFPERFIGLPIVEPVQEQKRRDVWKGPDGRTLIRRDVAFGCIESGSEVGFTAAVSVVEVLSRKVDIRFFWGSGKVDPEPPKSICNGSERS
jgi:hypothetical protein